MIPAVKHFDPVMGVDIHILIVPMVGPVPIPHPHIAMIMDPMDFVPMLGATVLVGPMRRGTAGTAGKVIPHIPMGAPFSKPPMNECEIFMGSAMVLADGSPMTFTALPVLSCHDIGMISPPRKKPKKTYGMVMPTSMVTAIPAGLPVLVGGPPTIDMMGMAMAGGMKALGAAMGKVRKLAKSSKRMKKISDAIHDKAAKKMDDLGVPPNIRNKVHKKICSITGHPVDVASGKLFTDTVDFELPGPLPLKWERTWFSTSIYQGPLGHGWHHSYDVSMAIGEKAIAIRMADGRPIGFPLLEVGQAAFHRGERCTLIRDSRGYAMDTAEKLRYRFYPQANQRGHYALQSVTEKTLGACIRFSYTVDGHLKEIIDSAGRFILLDHDEQGRIRKIHLPTPDHDSLENTFCAVEYHYENDQLIRSDDALKSSIHYAYENGLLVKETLKNGLNFYFKFDGRDHRARCIETWGDGELYYRKLEYDTDNNITKVFDSHGNLTVYEHNESLPLQITNPLGFVSYIEYNHHSQIVREIDEMGRISEYEYDDFGNKVKHIAPGGAATSFAYDDNQNLISVTDPVGSEWKYQYDNCDRVVAEIDPLGNQTRYQYNDSVLIGVTDAAKNQFEFSYDRYGNVCSIADQQGVETQWTFDTLGNLISTTDGNGNCRRFEVDLMGQVTKVLEPDGNVRELHYDRGGNVIRAKDQQYDVHFRYAGMDRLVERTQEGVSVKFEYDTEEQLLAITNEKGRVYRFAYDKTGELQQESGFDEVMREYYRDPLGRITRIQRPGGRFSEFVYSELGPVQAVKTNDGFVETYDYAADGTLTAAKNPNVHLRFQRNAAGWVEKAFQDDFWIESEFDALGNRTRVTSSMGLDQRIQRNSSGEVEKIGLQEDRYTIDFTRDQLGLEMERSLPGGIRSRWKRDKLGRPCQQEILQKNSIHSSKRYVWGVNNRLQKVIDHLNNETVFNYDALGNLVSSQASQGDIEWRMPDAVGNLFKSPSRDDREYGPAGELLSIKDSKGYTRFEYDPEGNLIRKTLPEGAQWHYRWNGVGMLAKVIRPDGDEVVFEYDPLGRRIGKIFRHKKTRWVWDGDVPIHEWVELSPLAKLQKQGGATVNLSAISHQQQAALQPIAPQGPPHAVVAEGSAEAPITWLFEPDSHIPMGKWVNDQFYSIVTDYLGTPNVMFDQDGKEVWSGELDSWGNLKNSRGHQQHCPFRWQGQYADEETGLYYNRFRYFDPEMGRYVSQDPIGLDGGFNLFSYVPDPHIWIDPFGLSDTCGGGKVSKKAELLRTGGKNTTVNVKNKAEADKLLKEAFPDYQKVRGVGPQDANGIRKKRKMDRFKQGGAYHKDYAIDSSTGRVRGHDPKDAHGEFPHINIKRTDGTKVIINIVGG